MPSRMEKYYQGGTSVKRRSDKNQDLYRTIYEEGEYTNVEGISIIEKNEKIDIEKIRELIGSAKKEEEKPKEIKKTVYEPLYQHEEEEKSYDIKDVLNKAKSERPEPENKFSNTQYNILKNIHLDDTVQAPSTVDDADLKSMIEAITTNSKLGETGDLLDDLKTIHAPNLKEELKVDIAEKEETQKEPEIDRSFFTSSLGFTSDDFEDLKEMKDSLRTNNVLTKILLFILLVVIVTGVMFLVYHFMQ